MREGFAAEVLINVEASDRLFEKYRECMVANDREGGGNQKLISAANDFMERGVAYSNRTRLLFNEWGVFEAAECLKVGDCVGVARNLRSAYDCENGSLYQMSENYKNLEISISRLSRKAFLCLAGLDPAKYTVSSDGLCAHLFVSAYGTPFVLVKGLDGYALVTYSEPSSVLIDEGILSELCEE